MVTGKSGFLSFFQFAIKLLIIFLNDLVTSVKSLDTI